MSIYWALALKRKALSHMLRYQQIKERKKLEYQEAFSLHVLHKQPEGTTTLALYPVTKLLVAAGLRLLEEAKQHSALRSVELLQKEQALA